MNQTRKCVIFSMLLTCGCMTAAFLLLGIFPFGDKTLVTGDLGGIYMPIGSYLGQAGDLDLFSFSKGLGGGLQGLIASFSLAPYFILFALIPPQGLGVFYTILMFCKQIAAAGAMTFYLSKKTKPSYIVILLGICYALMNYTIVYMQNTMWMDTIILLPLILHALDRLLTAKKPAMFCILLVLAMLFNYYTAYMICIFLVLYFIWEVFGRKQITGREILPAALRFAGSGLLAFGLSAFALLPAFIQTLENKGMKHVAGSFIMFSIRDLFRQGIYCGFTWDQIENGLPLIYCGFLCIFGVALYFCLRRIGWREKLFSGGVLLAFLISFWIRPLNQVWHLFRDPIWFPYRYSFLFCAFMVLLAALALEQKQEQTAISKKEAAIAGALIGALLLLIVGTQAGVISYKKIAVTVAMVVAVSLLGALLLLTGQQRRKRLIIASLALFVAAELTLNCFYVTGLFELRSRTAMREYITSTQALLQEADDSSFYRIEKENFSALNDPLLLGYHGINHFSSVADAASEQILKDLGYSGVYKTGTYATLPANALLGMRYLISDTEFGALTGYSEIARQGNARLYETQYSLPFAFYIENTDITLTDNPFENLNRIYSAILGEETILFQEITLLKVDDKYEAVLRTAGQCYAWFAPKTDGSFLVLDGKDYGKITLQNSVMGTLPLGYHTDTLSFTLNSNQVTVYQLNDKLFADVVDTIRQSAPDIRYVENGRIELVAGRPGTLMLSMAYYPDWTVSVDGEAQVLLCVFGNFAAVSADHANAVINLRYRASGLTAGVVVSAISLGAAIAFCGYAKRCEKKRIELCKVQ